MAELLGYVVTASTTARVEVNEGAVMVAGTLNWCVAGLWVSGQLRIWKNFCCGWGEGRERCHAPNFVI